MLVEPNQAQRASCLFPYVTKQLKLVRYLAANSGRAISRDELLANVWRITPKGVTTRTIDMHIARLREKIELDLDEPTVILTVRGKGYMFGGGSESQ